MMTEIIIRRPLPTFAQARVDAEHEGVQHAIDFLFTHGFHHAAHRLSVDHWGYGMEDTEEYDPEWEKEGPQYEDATQPD